MHPLKRETETIGENELSFRVLPALAIEKRNWNADPLYVRLYSRTALVITHIYIDNTRLIARIMRVRNKWVALERLSGFYRTTGGQSNAAVST